MAAFLSYAESLAESTSTSSTYASKVSTTPTLVSGTTYLIIWSCQIANNDTSGTGDVRLRDHTGSVTIQSARIDPKDTTDYRIAGSVATFTAASSAANEFRIELAQTGTGTGAVKNARILIIALDAGDFSTSSVGDSTTSSGSFQDKCTLSVNGADAGDYLFLAGAITTNADPNNIEIQGLKTDGTTAVNTATGLWTPSTINGMPYAAIWVETLTGANVSAKLQYRSLDAGSVGITTAYLVAINTASLGDAYAFTIDGADDAGTSSVIGDSETLSGDGVDTVGGDVLVIAAVNYKGNGSTISSLVDFREASTTIIESITEDVAVANGDDVVGIVGYKSSSANDPETWRWRRRSESGSGTTTTVNYAAIAVLGLSGGATDYDQTGTKGPIVISPKVATLQADQNLTATKGPITINGKAATILVDTSAYLDAAKGAIVISGKGATLTLDQNLDANDGAVLINGQSATISVGQDAVETATAGSVIINGKPATITTDLNVTATRGAIVINGQPPVLVVDANLAASAGAIAIAGKPATMTITADAILSAGKRQMSVNGQPGWIYTEDLGGSITVIPNATDGKPGTNWYEMVLAADPDYEAVNDRPVIYRFGKPEPDDRRFERQSPEYYEDGP